MKLKLGRTYWIRTEWNGKFKAWFPVTFIKVSPKGFNFMDQKTFKCILNNHMFMHGGCDARIHYSETVFNVGVPHWVDVSKSEPPESEKKKTLDFKQEPEEPEDQEPFGITEIW